MSQASRSAAVDIDDIDGLEMQDMDRHGSFGNRRPTIATIKNRTRKSTQSSKPTDLGHVNFNRTYLKVKKLNQEIGLRRVWNALIKVVEDKLGADATAYFSMVAWLFWMLLPSIIIVLGFLVVPQMYYRFVLQKPLGYEINNNFTWHDFFTGEGWLEKTELFEGYYTNATISPPSYEMPIAYFATIAICYFSFFLILAKSYAQAISERYVEHDRRQADSRHQTAVRIQRNFFCYWDFTICNKATAEVCRSNILEDMKKFLAKRDKEKGTTKQLFINISSNIFTIVLIFGVSIGIFFAATGLKYSDFMRKFAVSVMTSVASVIVPPILSLTQFWENYRNRNVSLFVPLFRNCLLQTLLFFTFIFILFTRAACFQHKWSKSEFPLCKALVEESETDELQCWETWFGQQIYRWQIVDLISVFVLSFVLLCLRRAFACCGLGRKPIVNVEQMVMHLFLTQCFTWFGVFASPLLPLIFLIKLILSFLWFRFLVTRCCRPSNEPWKSKYAMDFFRGALLLGFILSVGGMVTAISILKLSKTCGPFTQYSDMIEVIKYIRQGDQSNPKGFIALALAFFNSVGFNVFFTLCLVVFLLLMRRTAQSKDENLKLLRSTIKSLNKDKVYYTKVIKKCEAENPYYLRTTINRPKDQVKRTPSGSSIRSEDALTATLDPHGVPPSLDRNRSVEFAPLDRQNEAESFVADNLAFEPDNRVPPAEADNLAFEPDNRAPPSEELPQEFETPPEREDSNLRASDASAASDYGLGDEGQLIRKASDAASGGIDSPFFAGRQDAVDPRSYQEDAAPDIPLPDY